MIRIVSKRYSFHLGELSGANDVLLRQANTGRRLRTFVLVCI